MSSLFPQTIFFPQGKKELAKNGMWFKHINIWTMGFEYLPLHFSYFSPSLQLLQVEESLPHTFTVVLSK